MGTVSQQWVSLPRQIRASLPAKRNKKPPEPICGSTQCTVPEASLRTASWTAPLSSRCHKHTPAGRACARLCCFRCAACRGYHSTALPRPGSHSCNAVPPDGPFVLDSCLRLSMSSLTLLARFSSSGPNAARRAFARLAHLPPATAVVPPQYSGRPGRRWLGAHS